ncbi:MAG: outer membrane beta-barrel protein [Woeseiaceae bacterium]
MKLKMRSNALLLCLGFGLVASAQAAELGWYGVGFGGESSASGISQSQTDENLVASFESVGLAVVDFTSTLDDSDTGFGFAGGYQLNDHFAMEFAYVDLGSVDYRASATVSDGVDEVDADVGFESSANGPVLSVLGILPIGERFSLFGRVGLSLLNADGTVRIALDGISQRASPSSQKSDPMLGVGAELSLSKHFAIRLAWDRYFDVGTENVTGDVDADLITLGVRMGLGWFR